MDFKQLRSFVAIVDYRNFSKAAEKLNIAQSSVSTHLLQLEKELGARLLHRTTKTIEVTDAGEVVYKYASQILELEDHVYQTCSGNARRILRIGASSVPAAYILPGVLQQYRELFPNDCLKIGQCESKAVAEGVLNNRFDAGLIGQPVKKNGLKCIPVCRNRTVMITPATERYRQMQQRGVPVGELLKEPIILREEGHRRIADFFLDRMGIEQSDLRIVARVNDQETVKNMVAAGMGISVISEIAARDFVKARRLLQFELPEFGESQNICLVFQDSCTSKEQIWNFIDFFLSLHL